MSDEAVLMLICLMLKHTLADYFLQKPWKDKGIYGSIGGIQHAIIHAFGTLLVLYLFVNPAWAVLIGIFDGIIHYHIDWAKNQAKAKYKLDRTQTLYWGLHGVDQYLHFLTYILIIYILG